MPYTPVREQLNYQYTPAFPVPVTSFPNNKNGVQFNPEYHDTYNEYFILNSNKFPPSSDYITMSGGNYDSGNMNGHVIQYDTQYNTTKCSPASKRFPDCMYSNSVANGALTFSDSLISSSDSIVQQLLPCAMTSEGYTSLSPARPVGTSLETVHTDCNRTLDNIEMTNPADILCLNQPINGNVAMDSNIVKSEDQDILPSIDSIFEDGKDEFIDVAKLMSSSSNMCQNNELANNRASSSSHCLTPSPPPCILELHPVNRLTSRTHSPSSSDLSRDVSSHMMSSSSSSSPVHSSHSLSYEKVDLYPSYVTSSANKLYPSHVSPLPAYTNINQMSPCSESGQPDLYPTHYHNDLFQYHPRNHPNSHVINHNINVAVTYN